MGPTAGICPLREMKDRKVERLKPGTVLVLENQEEDFRLIQRYIRHGFSETVEILHARTVEAALDVVSRHRVDCALVDYALDQSTGMEFLYRSRHFSQAPAVVMLTAFGNETVAVEAMKAGARDYLPKEALSREALAHAIIGAMERAHQAQEEQQKREDLARANTELQRHNTELEGLVRIDELTQVANRRHFDELMHKEIDRSSRQGPLSLLLIDLDHFKLFNDRYGHIAGDQCLRAIARALESCARRSGDQVARFGGEEMAMILPVTSHQGAMQIAEQARLSILELAIPHLSSPTHHFVTASIGAATVEPGDIRSDRLIRAADEALYRAKQLGRNRVVSASMVDGLAEYARCQEETGWGEGANGAG